MFRKGGRFLLTAIFLLLGYTSLAQGSYTVSGKVIEAETKEPLAFVNIIITGSRWGTSTDIDGKFTVSSTKPINSLNLTYVGYIPMTYTIQDKDRDKLVITLQRRAIDLEEVVILPTINPAHRIINLVLENRDRNDPEKKKSFSYTAYEKTIFTARMDTLNMYDSVTDTYRRVPGDSAFAADPQIFADSSFFNDSIPFPDTTRMATDTTISDSSFQRLKAFFDKQDIAIMETVVERKFMSPDRNYEKVVAQRISGFQDPIFVFLISQIQSTSFYKELFHIADKYYVNPISRGSTSRYIFLLEDTLYTPLKDSVFIISFRPRPNTNFDGMKGLLYINSRGWAIQNVIARPVRQEGFSIKIQQQYELIDSINWFPVQLNTDVIFGSAAVQAGNVQVNLVGIGKSYIRDVVLNPEKIRREMDLLGIDVEPGSHQKPESFWNGYRIDTLSERDIRTYQFLDSIGREANFDRIARSFETIMRGKIPWKIVDIDLDKIIRYNGFEGIYLGLGAHTNDRLSRYFKIGGYWGYGFKDKTAKYGGDASVILNRRYEVEIGAAYSYDVTEAGGTSFFEDRQQVLTGDNWRALMIKRMYPTESLSGWLRFRALRDFKFGIGMDINTKTSPDDYRFGVKGEDITAWTGDFRFTDLKVGFRFAFREEFIVTKRTRMSLGSRYPIVFFQYTRGLSGVLGGAFEYNRYDLKIEKSFYTKYLGKTNLQLRAGYIDRAIPESNLFNGNESFRTFTLYSPNSFATMRMNEFLSDRYIAFYFSHNFGKLLARSEKFQPEFVIATHIGFGFLSRQENHFNLDYKTMEHGYYESGLLVNNLLNLQVYTLGAGVFYRYGPYGFDLIGKNFAYKISVIFPFN
jgi:hypothetical protein